MENKLKTLKDIECEVCADNGFSDIVCSSKELRQEAIKWIKEYPIWKAERLNDLTVEWIKHFFNIEESDLR